MMKRIVYVIAGLVFTVAAVRGAVTSATHVETGEPTLMPLAHAKFCLTYPDDCEKKGKDTNRSGGFKLTPERRAELVHVNARINATIVPERVKETAATEKWVIEPPRGDCSDFAVSKRHELLEHGWPSSALLLAHVILPSGEHHLVLVARTNEGDFVLDNLKKEVRPLAQAKSDYQWVRMEAGWDPKTWLKVRLD